MRPTDFHQRDQPSAPRAFRPLVAFTLIELMVVITIILVLIGLLFPAVTMVRNKTYAGISKARVLSIIVAMETYVGEDPRHLYPTPASNDYLIYDLQGGTGVITLLEKSGYQVNTNDLEPIGGSTPGPRALLDGWSRPLRYRLDGPVRIAGVIDSTAMNGTADRPAPVLEWNPKGKEPFAYVWSIGQPQKDEVQDALPANAANWIFPKGTP